MDDPPLIVLVGPTGVGKTSLGVILAQALDGEIVSADSRQIYHHLTIGTAKPTPEEMSAAPHHLVDFLDPAENFTLAEYQRLAYLAINDILSRGTVPLLVGGTGQYVRAVVEGWGIPEVPPDPALRADLAAFADVYGASALHEWLVTVDTAAASAIDYRNVRRVIRALEVYLVKGVPITDLQRKTPPPYRILLLGLTMDRDLLYERIDQRITRMIAAGLVEEVRQLEEMGYRWDVPAMSSLGYPEIRAFLEGEITLAEAEQQIRRETRRFIRQQYNWFKVDSPDIHWFHARDSNPEQIIAFVQGWLTTGESSQS